MHRLWRLRARLSDQGDLPGERSSREVEGVHQAERRPRPEVAEHRREETAVARCRGEQGPRRQAARARHEPGRQVALQPPGSNSKPPPNRKFGAGVFFFQATDSAQTFKPWARISSRIRLMS